MTDDQAALAIDRAHKAYQAALGTDLERQRFHDLCEIVARIKYERDVREMERLLRRAR